MKDFWDILKVVTKNKEYCDTNNKIFFVSDLYSAYKSKAQHLEFNYFSKTKFDYSIKREDLLKEAIDISAKVGDWEKFCELCIEANEWEKAIMAAPNISLTYWKELTKKYSEVCQGKTTQEKKFISLLSNELQPALKVYMESGDYEDAKLIWVTRGNNSQKKENFHDEISKNVQFTNATFSMNDDITKNLENKLKNLNKDDDLYKISCIIAKEHLQKGFPILAAATFLSIKDIFNTFKMLIRANEIEIAYMVMKILDYRIYEEEIMMGLMLKELKKGNTENAFYIMNSVKSVDNRVILASFLRNYKKINMNITDMAKVSLEELNEPFIYSIASRDVNNCLKIFYQIYNEISQNVTKNQINDELIKNAIKMIFFMKGLVPTIESYFKILILGSFVDALNSKIIYLTF